jgi:succinate dehydrogenase/fumarate reductase flavoprotein subunit
MTPGLHLAADVLVIGGGLAGGWAAIAAAEAGASVVLAEKGYFGTSGVAASAGPGHWWVPPDPAARAAAVRQRLDQALGLGEASWMQRIIETCWDRLPGMAPWYRFGVDEAGRIRFNALRGPEYLRALRQRAESLGVTILDQSPALELLRHADGSVAGARGERRQLAEDWEIRAGGVVLATGGCAFGAHLLGSRTNTGEGHLMAAEAGVGLSGMEFSTYHTVAPVWSSMTRSMSYAFATYSDEAGREFDVPPSQAGMRVLGRALLEGPVYCHLGRMPSDIRAALPRISPNVLMSFRRRGIDPFHDRFEITLRGEGTIRGVGGLRIADARCQTSVPGLYAVGDVATREPVTGAVSGGGAVNAAWALSSGIWAGQGAAVRARALGRRGTDRVEAVGRAGLRGAGRAQPLAPALVQAAVQAEMLPLDKILFRRGPVLAQSLARLDGHWQALRGWRPARADRSQARETAGLLAMARWCTAGAFMRQESRGLHHRADAPAMVESFARRIEIDGVDAFALRTVPVPAAASQLAMAG